MINCQPKTVTQFKFIQMFIANPCHIPQNLLNINIHLLAEIGFVLSDPITLILAH